MLEVENAPGLVSVVINRARRSGLEQCRSTKEGEQKNQGEHCFPPWCIPELLASKHTLCCHLSLASSLSWSLWSLCRAPVRGTVVVFLAKSTKVCGKGHELS